MSQGLSAAWEQAADAWVTWARAPELDDDYWGWHRDAFLAVLPPPGGLTVDVGCGEGRLSRTLAAGGHRVLGLDHAATMVRAAAAHPDAAPVVRADATAVPVADGAADLVVFFMCLHDIDAHDVALAESARVLVPGGRVAIALLTSRITARLSGGVEGPYEYPVENAGATFTYPGRHRPLEGYLVAAERAGLLIADQREPERSDGNRPFLHLLLTKDRP